MKYEEPNLEFINLKFQNIICTSPGVGDSEEDDNDTDWA